VAASSVVASTLLVIVLSPTMSVTIARKRDTLVVIAKNLKKRDAINVIRLDICLVIVHHLRPGVTSVANQVT